MYISEYITINSIPVPKQRVWDLLQISSHHILLNANDTFAYACGESVELSTCDFKWALPIIEKYESEGVTAIMCYIKKQLPVQEYLSENLFRAIKEIGDLNPSIYSDHDLERMTTPIPYRPSSTEVTLSYGDKW